MFKDSTRLTLLQARKGNTLRAFLKSICLGCLLLGASGVAYGQELRSLDEARYRAVGPP